MYVDTNNIDCLENLRIAHKDTFFFSQQTHLGAINLALLCTTKDKSQYKKVVEVKISNIDGGVTSMKKLEAQIVMPKEALESGNLQVRIIHERE
jgi:hypothetical protein